LLGDTKVRQLVNLLEAKLEQGVQRHLDDRMQEVVDYRYFKITTVDKGVENKLQLRFDKYRDYKEWGTVLLEATLTNEALS
jgi:uncharacterized protein YktA (UPF0223 family)